MLETAPPSLEPVDARVIYRPSDIESPLVPPQDSPDVAVTTASNTTQSENSVFVNPNNPDFLVNSNNSSDWPVSTIYGADAWVSTNGGQTWTGSVFGPNGSNRGDPSTAINLSGRVFVGYIAFDYGQFTFRIGAGVDMAEAARLVERIKAYAPTIADERD